MAVIKDLVSTYGHEQLVRPSVNSWTDDLGFLPLFLTLVLPLIIGFILLINCIFNQCCPRKSRAKEELFGVEGRMTMLSNSESAYGVNNNTSASLDVNRSNSYPSRSPPQFPLKKSENVSNISIPKISSPSSLGSNQILSTPDGGTQDELPCQFTPSDSHDPLESTTNSLKRSTVQRQLPDLPKAHNPPRRSSSLQSHDGTSELYATVEEFPGGQREELNNENHLYSAIPSTSRIPNRCCEASTIELHPSSDSETYTTASVHPYAKLRKQVSNNPYAKVRKSRSGSGIAEVVDDADETDTDNYDISHPYAQISKIKRDNNTRSSDSGATNSEMHVDNSSSSSTSGNETNTSSNIPSGSGINSSNQNPTVMAAEHPIPPIRVGRQWAINNNHQANFSGDSQDSRGYTSISVREPLSNILIQANERDPGRRGYDTNYATVSDDSEEMYAAIEESNEVNYMEIGEESRDWREHREANSPLPPLPVCNGMPPEHPSVIPATANSSSSPSLPIYAQILKKKKSPTTKLSSFDSTLPLPTGDPKVNSQNLDLNNVPVPLVSTACTVKHHRRHSKVLDPSMDPLHDPERRWSKADINYSEFEVIREPLFPVTSAIFDNNNSSKVSVPHSSTTPPTAKPNHLVDEDNYNIILQSQPNRSESNYGYSAISRNCIDVTNDLYHEIPNPKKNEKIRLENSSQEFAEKIDELEDEDGLYETVKVNHQVLPSSTNSANFTQNISSTNKHYNKHGYEKIKKKPSSELPECPFTTSDLVSTHVAKTLRYDIDEDDDPEEGSLYEQVKFPSYQRLEESQDSVCSDADNSNLYEDIRFGQLTKTKSKGAKKSFVIPKLSDKSPDVSEVFSSATKERDLPLERPNSISEVNQLYARIDKSKKKKQPKENHNLDKIGNTIISLSSENSIEYI